MPTEGWKLPQKNGEQITLNFDASAERQKICQDFNVPNNNDLIKRPDGLWYYRDQLVADYKLMMDNFHSGNDNADIFRNSTKDN